MLENGKEETKWNAPNCYSTNLKFPSILVIECYIGLENGENPQSKYWYKVPNS